MKNLRIAVEEAVEKERFGPKDGSAGTPRPTKILEFSKVGRSLWLSRGCFLTASKLFMAIALALMLASAAESAATWEGVDESVVEKFAENAGRPPKPPLINTDRGDLLLFLFLLAGATGGFVGGYLFRGLFPPVKPRREEQKNV